MASETYLFGIPLSTLTALLALSLAFVVNRLWRRSSTVNKSSRELALSWIKTRRTIMPKDCSGGKLNSEELRVILEAGNWAPTHNKCEPWRYSIIQGSQNICGYLDFLDKFYADHSDSITEVDSEKFRKKLPSVREQWPQKVSHLVLIGMRRQALPDKRLPEWEELSAVAMSVQNMHLMATTLENVAAFWSSHTWCKHARDSYQIKTEFFQGLLNDPEDRVLGAFLLGKYSPDKKFRSTRGDITDKTVTWTLAEE